MVNFIRSDPGFFSRMSDLGPVFLSNVGSGSSSYGSKTLPDDSHVSFISRLNRKCCSRLFSKPNILIGQMVNM